MNEWKYDEQSLTYKKIKKPKQILRNCVVYFVSSIVLSAIYYVIFALTVDTAQEKQLKKEYAYLESAYDSLNTNFLKAKVVLEHIKQKDTMIYRSVFKTNPTESELTFETKNFSMASIMENYDIVNMTATTIEQLVERVRQNRAKIEKTISEINADKTKFRNIPAIQPVENKNLKYNSVSVGMKIHPFYRIPKMHTGLDYTVPVNTKVFATADGFVENIIDDAAKGTAIYINHGNGYKTVYAHLSKALVSKGTKVKRGKLIALSGDSGLSIFPHLHYEVWKNGKLLNPINCFFAELKPAQLKEMIYASSNIGQSLD
ncbi:MAG: M23 family metallopeptidase [Prevotellaceae bacterium]|jgi:murein DD-endopeptidase MepM/ murein hydrolase activator NlpD|nr:M23 family metallopeptidase [Prevotellaceae bacterium]